VTVLVLVNDPPYGTERCYNALRLAGSLAKREDTTVRVFLMADAVGCAVAGQRTPDGYYNLERMLKPVLRREGDVACCGSCMDARGLTDEHLVDGSRRSSIEELADWTLWADKVVTF